MYNAIEERIQGVINKFNGM